MRDADLNGLYNEDLGGEMYYPISNINTERRFVFAGIGVSKFIRLAGVDLYSPTPPICLKYVPLMGWRP